MSILKFISGRNKGTEALKNAVKYVLNSEKSVEDGFFCNGVRSDYPAEDMELLQNILGKDSGRRYIHYILSFDDNVDERTAIQVSKAIAGFFEEEYQFIGNLHGNTGNVHTHIIMNSVNFKTGKKFSQSRREMLCFRDCINELLVKNGLAPVGKKEFVNNWIKAINAWESDNMEMDEEYYDPDEESPRSFFGSIDEEEEESIRFAEEQECKMKKALVYFHEELEDFPDDIDKATAEEFYYQWKTLADIEYE